MAGTLLNHFCAGVPPGVVCQLMNKVKECKVRWRDQGVTGKRNHKALCRPEIIKYHEALGYYDGVDMRSQRIVKQLNGHRPTSLALVQTLLDPKGGHIVPGAMWPTTKGVGHQRDEISDLQ